MGCAPALPDGDGCRVAGVYIYSGNLFFLSVSLSWSLPYNLSGAGRNVRVFICIRQNIRLHQRKRLSDLEISAARSRNVYLNSNGCFRSVNGGLNRPLQGLRLLMGGWAWWPTSLIQNSQGHTEIPYLKTKQRNKRFLMAISVQLTVTTDVI